MRLDNRRGKVVFIGLNDAQAPLAEGPQEERDVTICRARRDSLDYVRARDGALGGGGVRDRPNHCIDWASCCGRGEARAPAGKDKEAVLPLCFVRYWHTCRMLCSPYQPHCPS